ncbi:uncharacterized protein LOC121381964 [Gigantopelta aegis]|uniref:uncharacterized protein LOC121381964 n=1 Tax=Gigantopelta aegis TaxID=1735272 RepID=UPI001B887A21|nr:uncharacterized protein LOC121381964 [Gigantopelta aegis]
MMNHYSVNNTGVTDCKSSVFESSTETASVRLSAGVRRFTGFESDSEEEQQEYVEKAKTCLKTSINDRSKSTSASEVQNNTDPVVKDEDVTPCYGDQHNESDFKKAEDSLKNESGSSLVGKSNESNFEKNETAEKNDLRSLSVVKGNKSNLGKAQVTATNDLTKSYAANNNEPCDKQASYHVGDHKTCLEQLNSSDQEEEYIIHVDDLSNTPRDINKISRIKQSDTKLMLNSKGSTALHSAPEINSGRKKSDACSTGTQEVTVIRGNKVPSPENYGSQFEYHDRHGVKVSDVLTENSSTSSASYSPVNTTTSNVLAKSETSPAKDKYVQERFNPFDRDIQIEDDHFSDTGNNLFTNHRNLSSDSNHSPVSVSTADTWTDMGSRRLSGLSDYDDITNADLGLAEDHFSQPDGHFGLSSTEELDLAIENCVEIIKMVPQNSDKQKNLVEKLVQLRMKRQELKDGPEPVLPDIKMVVGHKFKERNSRSSKHYCEKCNAVIWGVLQAWYRCIECGYCCHAKCLISITRTCARVKVKANPTYCLSICPKKGLASQNYRCAECKSPISFKSGSPEPRLCDYSGNYYCESCHWNDLMVIPARVLHNWDFETRKVCRASKQFLRLMLPYAAIRIQDINPMLFNFVEELNEIKKLREELLVMKKYILLCAEAMENKLLLLIKSRQHFVDSSDIYSMKDLLDIQTDVLLSELAAVHSSWAQHIKSDCQLCRGRGFICELCDDNEVLFPFDSVAVVCSQCSSVMHRHCYAKKLLCPRCERRDRRKGN